MQGEFVPFSRCGSPFVVSHSKRENFKMRYSYRRKRELPYQIFIQHDGTEILCDRMTRPMWQRKPGQPAFRRTPPSDSRREYIPNIRNEYLYDGYPVSPEMRRRLQEIEADFIAGKPIEWPLVVERKPAVKSRPRFRLIDGGRS
jgi:hypothetical protein